MIPVRPVSQRLVHEEVPRHAAHRLEHRRIHDAPLDQLLGHHAFPLSAVPLLAGGHRSRLAAPADHRGRFFSNELRPDSQSAIRPRAP